MPAAPMVARCHAAEREEMAPFDDSLFVVGDSPTSPQDSHRPRVFLGLFGVGRQLGSGWREKPSPARSLWRRVRQSATIPSGCHLFSVAKSRANWLAEHWIIESLLVWIQSDVFEHVKRSTPGRVRNERKDVRKQLEWLGSAQKNYTVKPFQAGPD
jgi:hypothetical protein